MSRRSFVRATSSGALALALSAKFPLANSTGSSVGHSDPITAVRLGVPHSIPNNSGDTWAAAWADDGNLYTPSNDTAGFHGIDPFHLTEDQIEKLKSCGIDESRLSIDSSSTLAFNRLEGVDPLSFDGVTLTMMPDFHQLDHGAKSRTGIDVGMDGRTWKSSGCASIDGVIYWAIARHRYGDDSGDFRLRQTAADASLICSRDYGRTWSRPPADNFSAPMFPGSRFATPYFIDYGKVTNAPDGADRYVYAVSNNGYWDNGDHMILGRVLRTRIASLDGTNWEFLAGGVDGTLDSSWSKDPDAARAILENRGKLGETGAFYVPDRQRYLMIGWYYPAGSGKIERASNRTIWDFYEAPKPWGPWHHIHSHEFSPAGYYCPIICPKFRSKNKLYVLTAGDFNTSEFYRLTVVPIEYT